MMLRSTLHQPSSSSSSISCDKRSLTNHHTSYYQQPIPNASSDVTAKPMLQQLVPPIPIIAPQHISHPHHPHHHHHHRTTNTKWDNSLYSADPPSRQWSILSNTTYTNNDTSQQSHPQHLLPYLPPPPPPSYQRLLHTSQHTKNNTRHTTTTTNNNNKKKKFTSSRSSVVNPNSSPVLLKQHYPSPHHLKAKLKTPSSSSSSSLLKSVTNRPHSSSSYSHSATLSDTRNHHSMPNISRRNDKSQSKLSASLSQTQSCVVPIGVEQLLTEIQDRGVNTVGVFINCGIPHNVETMVLASLTGTISNISSYDIASIAMAFKKTLQLLPRPLFSSVLVENLLQVYESSPVSAPQSLSIILNANITAAPLKAFLSRLFITLRNIANNVHINGTTQAMLAFSLGPILFTPSSNSNCRQFTSSTLAHAISIVNILITQPSLLTNVFVPPILAPEVLSSLDHFLVDIAARGIDTAQIFLSDGAPKEIESLLTPTMLGQPYASLGHGILSVAAALKKGIRMLPAPLMPPHVLSDLVENARKPNNATRMLEILSCLTLNARKFLSRLFTTLKLIADNSHVNGMSCVLLAYVFVPVLAETSSTSSLLSNAIGVIATLISTPNLLLLEPHSTTTTVAATVPPPTVSSSSTTTTTRLPVTSTAVAQSSSPIMSSPSSFHTHSLAPPSYAEHYVGDTMRHNTPSMSRELYHHHHHHGGSGEHYLAPLPPPIDIRLLNEVSPPLHERKVNTTRMQTYSTSK